LSQAKLTEGLPLAPSYISLIERGQRRPSHQVLRVLASRLGCTVEYLESGRKGPGAGELEVELRFAELALRSGDAVAARARFAGTLSRAGELNLEDLEQDSLLGALRH
jgi:transcriptional regulator with XRE-family HTH domain